MSQPAPSNIEEVARLAGVSRSTVSRVINDEPNVSDAVRERVWQVIEETGYQPNAAARRLAGSRSRLIGMVIPRALRNVFTEPFFAGLLDSVAEALKASHYHLMLSIVSDAEDGRLFYRRAVKGNMLDGVLLASAPIHDPMPVRLLRDEVPFVMIGRLIDLPSATTVDVDNVDGARQAVACLLAGGRQRIATITGPSNLIASIDRLSGFHRAMAEADCPVDPGLIVEGAFTEDSGFEAMQALLPLQPDAVFVANDVMAIGAMRAIQGAGLRVPDDIALVGFDNSPITELTSPSLTSVHQPLDGLGHRAVQLLLDQVEGHSEGPVQEVLQARLVLRNSCGSRR